MGMTRGNDGGKAVMRLCYAHRGCCGWEEVRATCLSGVSSLFRTLVVQPWALLYFTAPECSININNNNINNYLAPIGLWHMRKVDWLACRG
jgi:hypothetical protein